MRLRCRLAGAMRKLGMSRLATWGGKFTVRKPVVR